MQKPAIGKITKLATSCIIFLSLSPVYAQTLSQAIQYAIDNNPDVIYAINQRFAADQTVIQAKSDHWPILAFNAGYGVEYSENPVQTSLTGNNSTYLNRQEATASATEHVYTAGGITNEISRTQANVESSAYKIQGIANDLALTVAQQYIQVLLQKQLVLAAQANVNANQGIAGLIGERTEAGIDRTSDNAQATGRVDLAQANLIAAQSNLDDSEAHFVRAVGTDPSNLVMPSVPNAPVLPKTFSAVLAVALQNHPTVQSANADIAAAIAQHNAAKSTDYPHVDLVMESMRDKNIDGIPGNDNNNLAMVRASYNLNLGGKDFARQRETAYQIEEAAQVRDRTIMQLEESTRLAWDALVTSDARLVYLKGHLNDSYSTLNAYKEQFKLDKRSLLDTLDQQNEYYQAQIEYIQEQYTELFARYRLLNDMGMLLNYTHTYLPTAAIPPSQEPTMVVSNNPYAK